ncbi:MAG: hypothetical protein HUJ42_01175 [Malacoplasma sp.]|nr:hypothetical protein [Malacoplasma sp.]
MKLSKLYLLNNSVHNVSYYRDYDYDYDDDYYYPEYGRRRPPRDYGPPPPPPPRRRPRPEPPRRESRRRPEPTIPGNGSKLLFNLIKRFAELFLIIAAIGMIIGGVGYILIKTLSNATLNELQTKYLIDVIGVSWVFGSISGIICAILLCFLFILCFFMRKGWFRKNRFKINILWLFSFCLILLLSIYFFFVAASLVWTNGFQFQNAEIAYILTLIQTNAFGIVKNFNQVDLFIAKAVNVFYHAAWGPIATGCVYIVIILVVSAIASFYFKTVNHTLDVATDFYEGY